MTELITEKTIRDRLVRAFPPHQNVIAFNLCGVGPYGHEMDFLRITRAGYLIEYEIKISAADIKAEAKKAAKHDELANGCAKVGAWPLAGHNPVVPDEKKTDQVGEYYVEPAWGPYRHSRVMYRIERPVKQFWIVVPTADLAAVAVSCLPDWAGVAVLGDHQSGAIDEVRQATTLPLSRKVSQAEREYILQRMYSRFWAQYLGAPCGRP